MFLLVNSVARRGRLAGAAALRDGPRPAVLLDVLETVLRLAESDPEEDSVGLGAIPNILGQVELDAGLMEGNTRRVGAVAALQGFLHPVSVARQVLERLPHVLLVGEGAARFAREIGAEPAELLTSEQESAWRTFRAGQIASGGPLTLDGPKGPEGSEGPRLAPLIWRTILPGREMDTAIALAGDDAGIASGTSTSGWPYKYPGRLGDSAIIGAGHYADSRFGAAACTHTGEMTIRAGTARLAVACLKQGSTPEQACHEAMADLRDLREGLISDVVLYCVDTRGNHCAVSTGVEARYWWWEDGMGEPEERTAAVLP